MFYFICVQARVRARELQMSDIGRTKKDNTFLFDSQFIKLHNTIYKYTYAYVYSEIRFFLMESLFIRITLYPNIRKKKEKHYT